MAYEYGSQSIDIKNPFRLEGVAYVGRAAVLILLAVFLMFNVQDAVKAGNRVIGWEEMGGGLVLLGFGIAAAYRGLFKLFRFYVGRGVPADLASTVSSQQSVMPGAASGGTTGFRGLYPLNTLAEMLLARKNPTFGEPQGWLPRLLHSLARNLIFLPYPMRNDVGSLFIATANTLVLFVLLTLSWFSGVVGLTAITNTPVMSWLVALVTLALVFIWFREATRNRRTTERGLVEYSPMRMLLWAGLAIVLPLALSFVHAANPLPELPVSPYPWFFATILGAAVTLAYGLLLALRRAPAQPPLTDVAEYRKHWQESVHPMDIFRAVEMTLANHRFEGIPNRVYESEEPKLVAQGSQNKGDFKGRTIQEIQPRPVADHRSEALVRAGVVAGQVLLLAAGVCVFFLFYRLGNESAVAIAKLAVATLLCWTFGTILAYSAHLYLSEIEFESDLIAFDVTGTFSESRIATGMSIYDSTRSENLIVRSSLTPWLLVSRLRTTIFAESGAHNLEQLRYVIAMDRNDALTNELVAEMQAYLKDRQIMAGVQSGADLDAASTIYQMNERTRANRGDGGAPLISNEMRDDKVLAPGTSGSDNTPGSGS